MPWFILKFIFSYVLLKQETIFYRWFLVPISSCALSLSTALKTQYTKDKQKNSHFARSWLFVNPNCCKNTFYLTKLLNFQIHFFGTLPFSLSWSSSLSIVCFIRTLMTNADSSDAIFASCYFLLYLRTNCSKAQPNNRSRLNANNGEKM